MMITLGGHGFSLTEEELLGYLLRWAMGSPMPTNPHIIEKHLYGEDADPWRVLGDDSHYWDVKRLKSSIHVITKLTRIKTRVARRAGCGSWSGQTSAKYIFNGSGQLIGSKKLFTFVRGSDATAEDEHHWIMNEYSLAGTYMNNKDHQLKHHDYVICRITRTPRCKKQLRKPRVKRLSGKKRVQLAKEDHVTQSSCDETPEEVSCSSGFHQGRFIETNNYDEIAQMIADSSVSSPGSIGFGELTQEDLDILNTIFIWT